LLKSDQWLKESQHVENALRGAINFRTVPGTPIYALGQPTTDAVDEVVRRVRQDHPNANKILWITLREEPVSKTAYISLRANLNRVLRLYMSMEPRTAYEGRGLH
jgi:hypothetical protein